MRRIESAELWNKNVSANVNDEMRGVGGWMCRHERIASRINCIYVLEILIEKVLRL